MGIGLRMFSPFFLFTEFVGVTVVNKIILASGAQFYNTSFVHCIVCSPPQVKSLSVTKQKTEVQLPVTTKAKLVLVQKERFIQMLQNLEEWWTPVSKTISSIKPR